MGDNFFNTCPAKSGPGFRELGNYTNNVNMNQRIAYNNGISRDDEYRLFLQQNGQKIINSEWNYLKNNNSCWLNGCIFDNPKTLVHPVIFNEEMKKNNGILTGRQTEEYACRKYKDYRPFAE